MKQIKNHLEDLEFLAEIQTKLKTIKLNKGSYVVSSVAKVNYIGYAENNSNKADKTPDMACSESGRNVYVWTEKLDQGKVSEIFARGYDSI